MLIDTHTHSYTEQFDNDRDLVIERAIASGVQKMILPNIDQNSVDSMWQLVHKYPDNCFPTIGIHPCDVQESYEQQLDFVEQELNRRKYYAIGETGIDLYWDKTTLDRQIKAFEWQIEKAKELQLPIIIHARDSFDEIFEVLDRLQDGTLKGVFHCFTGNKEQAEKIISLGLFLGIGGVLTFKSSKLSEVLERTDLSHVLLETDSPYLAPVPYRGKRNESSYVNLVAQKLAEVKRISLAELSQVTTANAEKLFSI